MHQDHTPAYLWRTSGERVAVLRPEKDGQPAPDQEETVCAQFSPDGERVLTGHWYGTLRFWDAHTGKLDRQMEFRVKEGGQFVTLRSAAYSPDGRRILLVYENNRVGLWDVARSGNGLSIFRGLADQVRAAALSPDGRRLLVLPGDRRRAVSGAVHPPGMDGNRVLTDPEAKAAYVYDVATAPATEGAPAAPWLERLGLGNRTLPQEFEIEKGIHLLGHEDAVTDAAFSPDGRRAATASRDGTVRLWDVTDEGEYATVLRGLEGVVGLAAFSPDGQRVLAAWGVDDAQVGDWGGPGGDPAARLWDATTGRPLTALKVPDPPGDDLTRKPIPGPVRGAQFSPDGQRVVTVGRDFRARTETANEGRPADGPDAAFTPVRVWDARTGKVAFALPGFRLGVRSAAFSPDGRRLLTVSDSRDRYRKFGPDGKPTGGGSGPGRDHQVRLWDATTGQPVRVLWDEKGYCDCAVWTPDGRRVFTAGHDSGFRAQLWDADTGQEVLRFDPAPGPVYTAAFSPDGRYVLGLRRAYVRGREAVPMWDAATGKPHALLTGHQGDVTAAAFSPDGRRVVTASQDRTARVWDAATGRPLRVLVGHARTVHAAAFSPDGRWVVTASDDGTARVWDADSGREFFTLFGHDGPVYAAAFSADGRRVLTASGDGTARLWPTDPLPAALARRPRELTADERLRFEVGRLEK
jgi:WD40 repeat protein